jgi:hypothetical protein
MSKTSRLIRYGEDLKDLYELRNKALGILCDDKHYTKKRSRRLRKIAVLIEREFNDVKEELASHGLTPCETIRKSPC